MRRIKSLCHYFAHSTALTVLKISLIRCLNVLGPFLRGTILGWDAGACSRTAGTLREVTKLEVEDGIMCAEQAIPYMKTVYGGYMPTDPSVS